MNKICAVSAGMLEPKKGNEPFRRAHRYLNYGLLGLASRLQSDVLVFHGHFDSPEAFFARNVAVQEAQIVLLSVPSFYALPWAERFASLLGSLGQRPEIHVGGRWVIDQNRKFIASRFLPDVHIHSGLGEGFFDQLGLRLSGGAIKGALTVNGQLDYNLLVDRSSFQPSVEVSRGCGLGCTFCEEAQVPLTPLKKPAALLDEVEAILECYGDKRNFYFESSMFAPSAVWVNDFVNEYRRRGMRFRWRTETRVDVLGPEKLQQLAEAGLKVIDLGLESGASEQLRRMGKSKDPARYLRRAEEILNACRVANIWAKVNLLLYPGETARTVDETRAFLRANTEAIYGVSTYPIVVYGVDERAKFFDALYRSQGARGLRRTGWDGVWDVDLSPELDSVNAKDIALEMARDFMPAKNYFNLKRFSYLDPRYDWAAFQQDLVSLDIKRLAFGLQ